MLLEAKNEQVIVIYIKCLELVCERILVIIITSGKYYFYKMNGDIGMAG